MTNVKDMTRGSPLSLILTFAFPLMIGNVFQQFYTVVDTMVVGKALGVDALAALGATDWLYWLVLGMIQGITQGFGILMAREFGAKQFQGLRKAVGGSVVLSCFCAGLFLILGQLTAKPMLVWMGTPAEILPWSLQYLRLLLWGIPIVMAYNLLATVLRSLGDGKSPLYAMIIAAFLNIGLDLVFVLVFHWGVAGAAGATLIAQAVSGLYCLWKIRKIDFMTLDQHDFALTGALSRRLLGLGSPIAAQNAIIALGGMIIQAVVNGYGVAFIGGFTATNKLYGILEIAATSYGYAMITYVGQNLGAGNHRRIRTGICVASVVALITSAVIAAVMLVFGRTIIASFLSGTPEEVSRALEVGYRYLTYMSLMLPVLYILHVSRSALQGMENTVLPMVSGIAEFIMRTGGVLLLPMVMGAEGVFAAEVLAWLGADLILVPGCLWMMKKIAQ